MEERMSCTVKHLSEHFKLNQVTGDANALKRLIIVPNTNRPGLELTGFYAHAEKTRIVIIGNKESSFLNALSDDLQRERFDFLTSEVTPLILVTGGNAIPEVLMEVANRKNFPVFSTERASSDIMVDMVTFLDEELAPRSSVHGGLMNVFGKGVLLIGDSGMGKSEVALELVLRGHALIADDRVDISRVKEKIIGRAPELLKGMLEIRGIGIIDVTQMFGVNAYLEQEEIDFVVELRKWDDNAQYLRAGVEEQAYYEALGLKIPHLIFPVKEGRNMAVLVESAVRDFMLKQRGIHSSKIFDDRVMEYIKRQSEEQ
ncbi:HPr(Ser) kinase/phosphatase [Erysipelothrix inopinata]|uniref:HPr kinase/phosphorylase n=1 Tax=Erysipelothrix inopinata TaxID=225084 RepID=A0A7G9RZX5_9FIRM|nr:HPr(Ser) kinase/phosphatase [Erysipelothrix inopinata]QNN61150.1 HPr(Ser) kinase/phosphatase [Erysipelothrix inopinata]